MVLSLSTILMFVPLGLASSLVFHHSDCSSPHITSMSNGRYKFYATFTKAIMVLAVLLMGNSSPHLVIGAIAVLQLGITAYVVTTLPYYRRWMNRYVCALHAVLAYLSVCTFVLTYTGASTTFTAASLGAVLVVVPLGVWLPTIKYAQLERVLVKLHEPMEEYIARFHNSADQTRLRNQEAARVEMERAEKEHRDSKANAPYLRGASTTPLPVVAEEEAEERALRLTTSFTGAQVMEVLRPPEVGGGGGGGEIVEAGLDSDEDMVATTLARVDKVRRARNKRRQQPGSRYRSTSKWSDAPSSTPFMSRDTVDSMSSLAAARSPMSRSPMNGAPPFARLRSTGSDGSVDMPSSLGRVFPQPSNNQGASDAQDNGLFAQAAWRTPNHTMSRTQSGILAEHRRQSIQMFANAVATTKHDDTSDPFTAQATAQRVLLRSGRNAAEVQLFREQLENLARDSNESYEIPVGTTTRDVELLARLELERQGNILEPARRWWLRPKPKTRAVERAMWLYATAARQYRHTPADIAAVKIAFAAFVMVYTDDAGIAQQALEAAYASAPSLDQEFEVFSRIRVLQQLRQSQSIGSGQLNAVALVEFQKRFNDALRYHAEAVKAIYQMFSRVARRLNVQGGSQAQAKTPQAKANSLKDDSDRIGMLVQTAVEKGKLASTEYKRLLSTHAGTAHLAMAYRMFVIGASRACMCVHVCACVCVWCRCGSG